MIRGKSMMNKENHSITARSALLIILMTYGVFQAESTVNVLQENTCIGALSTGCRDDTPENRYSRILKALDTCVTEIRVAWEVT